MKRSRTSERGVSILEGSSHLEVSHVECQKENQAAGPLSRLEVVRMKPHSGNGSQVAEPEVGMRASIDDESFTQGISAPLTLLKGILDQS
jgi:hypothetical protein